MSSAHVLMFVSISLIILFQVYWVVRILWQLPLAHGSGFFLNVEVPVGFYEGPGVQWLRRYHGVLLAMLGIQALVLASLVALGDWEQLPLLAPVCVGLGLLFAAFVHYTRRTLGRRLPRLSAVAIPMETRRLGDYLSWPLEGLVVAVVAGIWLAWLHVGVRVAEPILVTYIVMGMLPAKILLVRRSFPLAPERVEEHQRHQEANRRLGLRIIELTRWTFLLAFAGPAAVRVWHEIAWLRWAFGASILVLAILVMVIVMRGYSHLIEMGRDLRPIGSWSGPFRPGTLMLRGGLGLWVTYSLGLVVLLILFHD